MISGSFDRIATETARDHESAGAGVGGQGLEEARAGVAGPGVGGADPARWMRGAEPVGQLGVRAEVAVVAAAVVGRYA